MILTTPSKFLFRPNCPNGLKITNSDESFPNFFQSACDKRMSDKEDDLVSARQELRIAETKNMEEIARLKEDKLKSEDKLFQFKKDRDEIVDELGVLIKKRDTKIKELEEKLK